MNENYFDFLDEQTSETGEGNAFEISDDSMADWALQKVLSDRAELERLTEIAERQKTEIDEKLALAKKKCENKTSFLLGCLRKYFDSVEKKTTKTQESYQLLSGKLVRKIANIKAEVDKDALIKYLKSREGGGAYIKVTESADWANFKKKLIFDEINGAVDTETGEIIDFITLSKQPDTFDVKGA